MACMYDALCWRNDEIRSNMVHLCAVSTMPVVELGEWDDTLQSERVNDATWAMKVITANAAKSSKRKYTKKNCGRGDLPVAIQFRRGSLKAGASVRLLLCYISTRVDIETAFDSQHITYFKIDPGGTANRCQNARVPAADPIRRLIQRVHAEGLTSTGAGFHCTQGNLPEVRLRVCSLGHHQKLAVAVFCRQTSGKWSKILF
jgi:hypothetical protein